jgi:hypothetical protein
MRKQMGYFNRRKVLKEANFLDLTPLPRYHHERETDGSAKIFIPRFKGIILGRWLQPRLKHPWITISLDESGSATWFLCDGKRNVRSICQELRKELGDKTEPTEERVTTFLSQLYKNKIITFKEIMIDP